MLLLIASPHGTHAAAAAPPDQRHQVEAAVSALKGAVAAGGGADALRPQLDALAGIARLLSGKDGADHAAGALFTSSQHAGSRG